eukprot:SAG31_NODE_1188_length_9481_cov_14.760819_5_plen_177_part_00
MASRCARQPTPFRTQAAMAISSWSKRLLVVSNIGMCKVNILSMLVHRSRSDSIIDTAASIPWGALWDGQKGYRRGTCAAHGQRSALILLCNPALHQQLCNPVVDGAPSSRDNRWRQYAPKARGGGGGGGGEACACALLVLLERAHCGGGSARARARRRWRGRLVRLLLLRPVHKLK